MKLLTTPLPQLMIIQPDIFADARGYFYESYNKKAFEKLEINASFVQDNESLSQKNVLRGLHLQQPPYTQGKLVRVIKGAVLDVALDLRKASPTYGQHFSIELNEQNKTMLYVPEGFAHGFATLEDNTIFSYKCTNFYHKDSELTILWNDPALAINWQVKSPLLSEKDKNGVLLKNFKSMF